MKNSFKKVKVSFGSYPERIKGNEAQKNRRIHSCGECTRRFYYASLQ